MTQEGKAESLRMLGEILHRKNEQIRQLREENARLRGELTAAQEEQDRQDAEVFRLLREKPEISSECVHIVFTV